MELDWSKADLIGCRMYYTQEQLDNMDDDELLNIYVHLFASTHEYGATPLEQSQLRIIKRTILNRMLAGDKNVIW